MYRYILSPTPGNSTASGKPMYYKIQRKKSFFGLFNYWSNTGALMEDLFSSKVFVDELNKNEKKD